MRLLSLSFVADMRQEPLHLVTKAMLSPGQMRNEGSCIKILLVESDVIDFVAHLSDYSSRPGLLVPHVLMQKQKRDPLRLNLQYGKIYVACQLICLVPKEHQLFCLFLFPLCRSFGFFRTCPISHQACWKQQRIFTEAVLIVLVSIPCRALVTAVC